jgi:lipoprotein-anchoring transpeptidase ErfK/SrfK
MNLNNDEAHLAVERAREALRTNRRGDARQLAERAASLAPQLEDPWLILAAIASPRDSLEYIQKALQINPSSPRARKGMQWAMQRLQSELQPESSAARNPDLRSRLPAAGPEPVPSQPAPKRRARSAAPLLLIAIGILVCAAAGFSAMMSPVVASIMHRAAPARPPSWALVEIPKATYTPAPPVVFELQPTIAVESSPTPAEQSTSEPPSPTAQPTEIPTDQPTEMATEPPTAEPPTAEPTWSGSLSLSYVQDTPTVQAPAGSPANSPGYSAGSGQHWIDVNLSRQTLYAYEGDSLMNSFRVSTGTWLHPTVTGQYHIYVKLRYTDMSGPDYFLPNVPYTMYFFRGYGLHGTYWHHNFGTPMSHGCVNLSIPDSQWLYNFSSVGTLVNVHY